MSFYQFRPAVSPRQWVALSVVVVTLLGLPVLVSSILPSYDQEGSAVVLGSKADGWEVPVIFDDSRKLQCEDEPIDPAGNSWNCDGIRVISSVSSGSTDQDRTLRRMLKAVTIQAEEVQTYPIQRSGNLRLLESMDGGSLAMSLADDSGEQAKTLYAVLLGKDLDDLAPVVMNALRNSERANTTTQGKAA